MAPRDQWRPGTDDTLWMADGADQRMRLASPVVPTAATVLEVTGDSVRVLPDCGPPCDPPLQALVDAALAWIDDPVGLLDERPIAVADLWRSLMATLVGGRCDSVVVVHPPDWPRYRVDRVLAAANAVADRVEAISRDRWTAQADDEPRDDPFDDGRPIPRRRPATALLAATVVVLAGMALAIRSAPASQEVSGVTVVEGRMAVRIPAHWTVERVTGGPGSRRLQVSPPQDPGIALHLTSAYAPETTLTQAAEVLNQAITREPPGVFVDVRPLDEVAGRTVVTYREVRPGRIIAWSVVLAGSTRISIGCQSPAGREAGIRAVCDEAVRSAQER